jgi:hypothetical protein
MSYGQGGGWGQGGGFPGGPPPPGGGYGAPPPSGPTQEAPLARIPFTPEDEANLSGMARYAKLAGVALLLSVLFNLAGGIIAALATRGDQMLIQLGIAIGSAVIGLGVAAVLAAFLFRAGNAITKVVTTDGADQEHLVDAFRGLRGYFMVNGILIILAICLGCCLCVGGVVFAMMMMPHN